MDYTNFLDDLYQEHLEELEFLWQQRREAIRSVEYLPEEVKELDERIEAHVDGLVLGGEHSLPVLEEALQENDHNIAFSAAYTMLRMSSEYDNNSYAEKVIEALQEAEDEQQIGIREALCLGPIGLIEQNLQNLLTTENTAVALAAALVLAFHQKLDISDERLYQFTKAEDVTIRKVAWELITII